MSAAKIRNLMVRPSQSANLCFDVDGILGEMNAQLGSNVTEFNFAAFYANLGATLRGNPGVLSYNSQGIHSDVAVQASLLAAFRAEPAKALLDSAIAARQNAYFKKYGNSAAIITQMQQYYDATVGGATSKPSRLSALANNSQAQYLALNGAYVADARTGVVKNTSNNLKSDSTSNGQSHSISTNTVNGTSTSTSGQSSTTNQSTNSVGNYTNNYSTAILENIGGVVTTVTTGPNGVLTSLSETYPGTVTTSATGSMNGTGSGTSNQSSSGTTETNSSAKTTQSQLTLNTDYGYRVPAAENNAQFQRTQISLIDEQFSQFMFGQNLPNLTTVFQNELLAIDLGVKRLQVAYLNTILMSPISGVVSGLYKNLGDRVKAGEPVVRVENNASIFLVGTLVYRGQISLNSTVQVTTSAFDSLSTPTITGSVVAARGHQSEDDAWEVVVSCSNLDSTGNPIFACNYHFDYDDTTVIIS